MAIGELFYRTIRQFSDRENLQQNSEALTYAMLRTIKSLFILIAISFTILATAGDDFLVIRLKNEKISIRKENNKIVARGTKYNHRLHLSNEFSKHLALAYDARIISKTNYENKPHFVVLSREPSRPNAMGQGYCGAGYEEYLLLIEVGQSKIDLRDHFLLQSCLKSISIVIDRGYDRDDAGNGLTENSDGSFAYRLLDDENDKVRNLALIRGRFKVSFRPTLGHAVETTGE